jgi:hypothetical protein
LSFIIGLWFGVIVVILNYAARNGEKMSTKVIEKIYLDDIKIPENFKRVKPKKDKLKERIAYYEKTGEFFAPIVLNKDNVLLDGYISYLIAKRYGISKVKIERKEE